MLLLTNMDYVRECTIKDDYGGSLRFWCLQKARTGVCCEKGEWEKFCYIRDHSRKDGIVYCKYAGSISNFH